MVSPRRSACILLTAFAASACGTLRPEDAAIVAPLAADAALAADYPGAATVCPGVDLGGERSLREGDRALFGIEVVQGDAVHRHLLEVIAHRRRLGEDVGTARFVPAADAPVSPNVPDRMTRLFDLELVLRDAEGTEQQRSRIESAMELVFDESFVGGIVGAQRGDQRSELVARLRLGEIANLLERDPILKTLLRDVATIPWDVRLLWRREVSMTAYFERGTAVDGGPVTAASARCELPFDLFLNDSLLVRLMATIADPHGPTGAIAGITGLRAQDASHPENQIRMRLLGAARGPRSEWAADGALATCGYRDEGIGLAFSADDRWVAMPGSGGTVELRDLTLGDPSVPCVLAGERPVVDLAFLDATTLLVARADAVEVVDVAGAPARVTVVARHAAPTGEDARDLGALEVADAHTCFVGGDSGRIERWTFAADRAAAPWREVVRGDVWLATPMAVEIDGRKQTVKGLLQPHHGWLVAAAADRVLARSGKGDIELSRAGEGAWTARELAEPAPNPGRRPRGADGRRRRPAVWVAKGRRMVVGARSGLTGFVGPYVSLTGDAGTRAFLQLGETPFRYCHGFSPNGRYYAFVGPGFRLLVDGQRFLAAKR